METLSIARPTLPRGATFASRFAAEEKRKLFVVLRPFRAVLCSPTRERAAWNAQRKLRILLHRKVVSIAMPTGGWSSSIPTTKLHTPAKLSRRGAS